MMRTCDTCGAGDEQANMFYVRGKGGDVLCVCEGCSNDFIDPTPVKKVVENLRWKAKEGLD